LHAALHDRMFDADELGETRSDHSALGFRCFSVARDMPRALL
jgi:hypothetical protein